MERCTEAGRWQPSLSAMADGEDPAVPREQVEAHLALCEPCAAWYREAVQQQRLLRGRGGPQRDLTRHLLGVTEAHICACHTGGECHCTDCVCPTCTCQPHAS